MQNKKFRKLAVLSLLSVLALAGCSDDSSSEIYAKPSTYDNVVIKVTDGESEADIHNNLMSIIYDAMHEGSAPSRALEKVFNAYAESIFGVYNRVIANKEQLPATFVTLEDVYKEMEKDEDQRDYELINNFVKAHKVYWRRDENGNHINDQDQPVDDTKEWTPCDSERTNVVSMWESIELRICEAMYQNTIKGSATEDHFFDEYEYVKGLWKDGKKVDWQTAKNLHETWSNVDVNGTPEDPDDDVPQRALGKVLVEYTLEEKDIFSVVHRAFYQGGDFTYIEDEIVPNVYNDLLIEQYLLDEEISAVRTSRARKINVLKIEKYGSDLNAHALKDQLLADIYSLDEAPAEDHHIRQSTSDIETHYTALFKSYERVIKGIPSEIASDVRASAILEKVQKLGQKYFKKDSYTYQGVTYDYYEGTAYGDLIKDFKKFHQSTGYSDFDTTLYNKFTKNGSMSELEGLSALTLDISQKEAITKDWFIESSKPSLDSNGTINGTLFNISVSEKRYEVGGESAEESKGSDPDIIAKNLEKVEGTKTVDGIDRYKKVFDANDPEKWTWELREKPSANENTYICSINGAYFLKFDQDSVSANPLHDIVYDDGSAYYIVNVLEAVRDVKLRSKSDASYAKTRGTKVLNEIISEISKKVAETGSYASLAKEYWLKKMELKYHDQEVYDYFKNNYPDLFE